MSVQEVLKMGNALLLARAEEVEDFDTPELHSIITMMKDTMDALNGAGIAAPQIGISLRIVIFGVSDNQRYPTADLVPETILINPEISIIGTQRESDWEGCLSVPNMRGLVPRYTTIRYRGHDVQGNIIEREAEGFHARVVQHEVDHLDGVLYPFRIEDMKNFGYEDELLLAKDARE